jgi:RAB protein geranylgeranyltransferase component A
MDRNNYYGGESASYNLTQARTGAAVARTRASHRNRTAPFHGRVTRCLLHQLPG